MGTNLIRAMLLVSASAVVAAAITPAAVYAQETSYQIDIPAQSMGDALRALGKATKQNIVFSGSSVRGKRSVAVRGHMTTTDALARMLSGTGLMASPGAGGFMVQGGNASGAASGGAQVKGNGTLTGRVVDAATGRRLEGARISVRGTGQSTTSDNVGEYRLSGLPAGEVEIDVSFLGFDAYSTSALVALQGVSSLDIRLGAPQDIVVYASKSARALAINKEKSAENSSTVISSDLLGNLNGTTISEVLRRAPGVAFEQDPNTGNGTNIIVRGLAPDYNQVKLNGLVVPETSGTGRAANLGNILADSVSEITINKTLLPNQDSAGTGGLVEIETKSPLDRPARFLSVAAEFAKRGKGFGDDMVLSGTISRRFGSSQNFGLSASLQYRDQDQTNFFFNASGVPGVYLPLDRFGNPMSRNDIDPRAPFPFEGGGDGYYLQGEQTNYNRTKLKTLALNAAAEWQVSDATNIKFDYLRSSSTQDSYRASENFFDFSDYYLAPVAALGGEVRYVFTDPEGFVSRQHSYAIEEGLKQKTETFSLRGRSNIGHIELAGKAGLSLGSSHDPFRSQARFGSNYVRIPDSMLLPSAIDPRTGLRTSIFGVRQGSGFQQPLLTAEGFALVAPETMTLNGANTQTDQRGRSRSYTGYGSAKYNLTASVLKYVEVGFDYVGTKSTTKAPTSVFYDPVYDDQFVAPSIGLFGLDFADAPISRIGGNAPVRFPTQASATRLLTSLPGAVDRGLVISSTGLNSPFDGQEFTDEREFAGFLQARLETGGFEMIGGVRFSRVKIDSVFGNGVTFIDADGVFDEQYYNQSRVLVTGQATQENWLPRMVINYRPSEKSVVRLGYYLSVARPQIQQLTATQTVILALVPWFSPQGDRPALIFESGNPDLKPAKTHSFDVSAEYYMSDTSVIKAAAFYKRIENLLENNVIALTSLEGIDLPDDPRFDVDALPADIFISARRPVNNPDPAHIWGIELSAEQQLAFLPGFLSGFGIYANYTYTKSSKSQPMVWNSAPVYDETGNIIDRQNIEYVLKGERFNAQPTHSGTAGLRYSKFGIDSSLLYSYQSRRRSSIGNFGLDGYNEAVSSLDFRLEYRAKIAGTDARFYVEGNNLLKGASDPGTVTTVGGANGVPKFYNFNGYQGGRSLTAGLSVNF
jgi:TonB-dependent receptor